MNALRKRLASKMSDSVISVFGTYDFYAKALPGMAFVIGLTPLLPNDSIPLPNLAENFLVLISVLIVTALIGTLIGEFVHTVSMYIERAVEWLSRWFRNSVLSIANRLGLDVELPTPSLNQQFVDLRGIESDEDEGQDGFLLKLKSNLYNRLSLLHRDVTYALWAHRKIFFHRLTDGLKKPYGESEVDLANKSFLHKYLINKAIESYNIRLTKDAREVYIVVVSTLTRYADDGRAFRYQARGAFCRSMWVVLFLVGFFYWLVIMVPDWLVPNAMQYHSYLDAFTHNNEVGMIIVALGVLAFGFLSASGSYKENYIEYLMAEMYALDKSGLEPEAFEQAELDKWVDTTVAEEILDV